MLEVSDPGALNYYTLSRLMLLTLAVSRNPILTHLPLSEFLDFLPCDLIALTPSLALFLPMTHTLAAASSIFVKQDLSLSEHYTSSFFSLDSYFDYVKVNISLNNFS